MRRALLAGACLASLTGPAFAQMAVFDGANFGNTLRGVIQGAQQLQQGAQQIQQLYQQITLLQQQYAQLVATYNSLAHAPEALLNQLGSGFDTSGIRSPLPGSGALGDLIGGVQGANNALSGLVGTFTGQNRIYTPYGGDYSSNAMLTNANSIAGVQAAVKALVDSAQQHSQALTALEGQLSSAADTKAVGDIQARIAFESAQLNAKQIQAQALTTWQGAQVRLTDQQRAEARRCYIDAMLNGTDWSQDTCARPASQGAVQIADAGTTGTGASGDVVADDGTALGRMMSQSWGEQAAQNARALGVNPTALAATCVVESGCRANPGGTGTVSGAFQMTDGTYAQTVREVSASNPALANSFGSGKNDPGGQALAASQYLLDGAQALQARGITDPNVLQVRGFYNFGPGFGAQIALADGGASMSDVLSGMSASTLSANGIKPGETVQQWRDSVAAKIGSAAYQPVLIGGKA